MHPTANAAATSRSGGVHHLLDFLRHSVRGRLAFLVLAIAMPAALLVTLMVVQAYRNERRAVGQQLIATAQAFSAVVDQQLGHAEALLKGLAASRDLAHGDLAGFYERVRSSVSSTDRWIVVADATGQQVVNTRLPLGATLPRHAVHADYLAALAEGRTFYSNVVEHVVPDQLVVYVVVPVLENGRLKYALSYAMVTSVFDEALRPERFSPGMIVSIIDRNGTIAARQPNHHRFAGGKATPDIVAAVATQAQGLKESVTLDGHRVLAAHSRAPRSGWSVALGVPLTGLYASAERLLWLGLATSALLMTIAILTALWIARAVVRTVDELVADTVAIGQGQVPARRARGLTETDMVADAMRRTAEQLKERGEENARLTAELKLELIQRKKTEESASRLAAIVESSEDAIVSEDLKGIITSWNRGAERIFGYRAEEIVGRPISLLFPPSQVLDAAEIRERIRRGETIEHYDTVRQRKDGTLVPISLSLSPVRDAGGEIIGAAKIARDVTQRQRDQAQQLALFELVARVNGAEAMPEIYDAALDAIARCTEAQRAAILLFDAAGVMRFAASRGLSADYCRAVEGHSPWAAGDPNPQPVWIDDIVHGSIAPAVRAAVEAEGIAALAFVPLTYEKRLLGKFMVYFDAPHCFSLAELRPVQTIASQVAFAIERQRGAEALEALVTQRTSSLREVVAQLEEFSYSVSHDLRAPVRAMRGYADIILQDHAWRLDSTARELLHRIAANGAKMDRMIQNLLAYSRITRRELQLEPVSLDKVVREVVQQFPDMRPERADIEVEGPLPEVLAHEPSLTQVVSNLLSNAVKFVPPDGRPRVRVRFDQRDGQARLWICDNGIGIKPEHQARLFGMFERFHADRNYEGSGIGLAIVRKAIERMNGAVGVESDGVSGSRFWFELPIAARTPAAQAI